METIFQIGKGGVSDTLIKQVNDALKAREMIKLRVLENAPVFAREAAQQLAQECGAEIVQVIGSRFILFKRNPQKPIYEL
jgi:RNA-binding protein